MSKKNMLLNFYGEMNTLPLNIILSRDHDAKFLYEADVLVIESIKNTFINIDIVILWSSLTVRFYMSSDFSTIGSDFFG